MIGVRQNKQENPDETLANNIKTQFMCAPQERKQLEEADFMKVRTCLACESHPTSCLPRPSLSLSPAGIGRGASIFISDRKEESQSRLHLHSDDWQRTVYIDTLGVGTTDFGMSDRKKQSLLKSGREGTMPYFKWFDDQKSDPVNRPPNH